ncbi:response regulator transcription factor [Nocardioides pacificus]
METRHRALVVDDDQDVRDLVVTIIEGAGLDVDIAASGAEALRKIREINPDLVTLDLTLPDIDGMEVCRRLREFSDAFVIMITGRDEQAARLVGLESGADEYLAKPFHPRELRARVASMLRRAAVARPTPPEAEPEPESGLAQRTVPEPLDAGGGLVIDVARRESRLHDDNLGLTAPELDILTFLAQRPGQVMGRAEIVAELWGQEVVESDYQLDVNIGSLRRKLRKAARGTTWITTVDGSAYRFDRP